MLRIHITYYKGRIKLRNQPVLVVLDDIWSRNHLEKLLFEGTAYKTPVTTRDKELVIKVQQHCSGLPVALKVIGSSLYGESHSVWERAEKCLTAGELFKSFIRNILETSIDVLDGNEKQCFLDLGAIPQGKAIPAKALRDIWIYARGMKSSQADMLLWKFAIRHLLDLKKNPSGRREEDGRTLCMCYYSLRECATAIPQGKAIPAKALRDIWVYVRGMKSSQADMLLWKFAVRHLLDLKKNPSGRREDDGRTLCMCYYSLWVFTTNGNCTCSTWSLFFHF